MKTLILIIFSSFVCLNIAAQNANQSTISSEQNLENITAANNDEQAEDDTYLQELQEFKDDPINLNNADENELSQLRFLSAFQIQNLLSYRLHLGKLISIYELQALPGWDLTTISRIRPYIKISNDEINFASLKKRFRGGKNTVLFRYGQTLERAEGYFADPSSGKNYYAGSPQKIFLRYRYQFKNLLQFGACGEKDAGEQFFRGSQKNGFDFYSAHLFLRNAGIIKSLALGDFTVNTGQGLIQWMSLAFKKGPDILMVKREADVLMPYNSSGEINFHRGAGITLKMKSWQTTLFGSYRNIDANFIASDSVNTKDDYVTSFQTSGYHRTPGEAADKGSQKQLSFGGNISYNSQKLHAGFSIIQYRFKYPLLKKNEPYNLYALSGKSLSNCSADYSYTYRNMHFFGETALSDFHHLSSVNGLLISVSARADMSLVYRNISPAFKSLYADAFTESNAPVNENGLFAGLSARPSDQWRIDAYTDHWRSPWLRYRVNSPSHGADYFIRLDYKPDKKFEIYCSYKSGKEALNTNPALLPVSPVSPQEENDWRLWFSCRLKADITWRNRAEIRQVNRRTAAKESGFLIYSELILLPPAKPWSGNIRFQYFETESYTSRLYAYEDDLLYTYSVPVLYGKGYRYYLNFNYLINNHLSVWLKLAQTRFPGKKSISSYLDEIAGNRKTEIRSQLLWRF